MKILTTSMSKIFKNSTSRNYKYYINITDYLLYVDYKEYTLGNKVY
uniref:Uncharacterized protein n=1 Tax=Heterorhabditis bacteriophora TaxID=37862 RepID=A0A1I7WHS1_HETBA